MKKYILFIFLVLLNVSIFSQDKKDFDVKIKGKKFFRTDEKIVLQAQITDSNKSKKIQYNWLIVDKDNQQIKETLTSDKVELNLNEGKYKVVVIATSGKNKGQDSQEIYVSSKDEVKITFQINPPENTKESDTLFLAHEVSNHKEWVPYATQMKKNSNGIWEATLVLKTGKNFKIQPTKGSWGSKARDKNNSDFTFTYMPYIDESVSIDGFSWGNLIDNKKLLREPLLVPINDSLNNFKLLWNNQEDSLYLVDKLGKESKIDVKKEDYGFEAIFKDLKFGEEYFYKLGENGVKVPFRVPKMNETIKVAVIADSQNRPQVIEVGAKKIKSINPDLLISAGDNINDGLKAFSWELTFFKPLVPNIQGIPFVSAMGNHEEVSPLIERYLGIEKYYNTFSNGLVRFLIIDTQTSFIEGSSQYNYIENVLKNKKEKYLIVVMHDSPYAWTPRHYSNLFSRDILAPLFEKYKVSLVLTGHNHVYERTKPINGVTYITMPCFGSNKPTKPKDLNETIGEHTFKQVYDKDGFGVLEVSKTGIYMKIQTVDGDEIDSFEIK